MRAPEFEMVLPRDVDAPRLARRQLEGWFAAQLADGTLDTARLLVSELVTNAVRHGRGGIRLRAELSDSRLLVEVFDEGDGFAWTRRARDVNGAGVGGWGLVIVEADASRCGVSRDPTHVWFELDRADAWPETVQW